MLDHRLEESVDNSRTSEISASSSLDSEALAVDLRTSKPTSPQPLQPKSKNAFSWLRRGWDNLTFRTKLTLLLVGSAAIPVLVVTQGLITLNRDRAIEDLKQTLQQQGRTFANEYVLWTQVDTETQAENLANILQATGIDLNNSAQVAARREFIEDYLVINENKENPELTKNFKIITDAQGRTVAQNIFVIDDNFTNPPLLPTSNQQINSPKYRKLSLPTGISLTDIPIVQNALKTGQPLAGIELVKSQSLQKLGLDKQANIGLRQQPNRNLPEEKTPFPEGTYEIDGGKAGLLTMAVHPIKANNRVVGAVVIGTLLNRNYGLVDKFSQNYNVPTATVFAKDWRVVTNVPYTDNKTRAIGTRVARGVAEKVLNQGEEFIGETSIVGRQYLAFYTPLYDHQQVLNPEQAKPVGIAYVGESFLEAENQLANQQLIAYSMGGGILFIVGLISIPIANSFARPMRKLSGFAQQVASGEAGFDLDVDSDRQDELGVLSREMNIMAQNIAANLEARRQEAERAKILKDITVSLSQALGTQNTLDTAAQEIRLALKADRVVVYSFDEKWQGTVTSEAIINGFPQALGAKIADPCFADRYVDKYRRGRVQATENIYAAGLTECHIKQLEQFAVKANLVAPIITNGKLIGLLIAHQCSAPRAWQQVEIDLFSQLATQVGFALDRVNLLEQQKAAKEQLQRRALELLMEVDPLTQGDLTIRASVTEDEIGTIADSYNATISSLRQIVTQVQEAAQQVAITTTTKESSVAELSQEASRQAAEITSALARIQQMANSIRAVAASAEQAEAAVQQASQTVAEGDTAMNRTVDGILAIRETVAQTSKKVKRLGESSQKISKVVNLISTFADQTNLLALNAAIEAANAGEQGRGFAVVAERVRALARQSTEATAEIEKLVTGIQTETNEVVAAMEAGTEQVVAGTRLVDETRQSLNKISDVSNQINELVKAIATVTVEQSQASAEVTQTMSDVAAIAHKTLTEATQVAESFKELLAVAQKLQANASQFKVN
ncbi:methyl-accepting chemotaxis sensory transducer with GAF sensor [Gloeocapsa sp. PCC 7428]|uniref:methyl-accepting chemotaxis protein n=1 Tax=Gloeocapsa sp. PCC 7428 TaxID=1173026 RepID=UPI0002A60356|nr:methyl-accepting chemotaxis protein [Gloeocapsa sp. PCC 7428]AFZ30007.1 methyl-accepting chemotaxis sensory transducer with GAF sensor [Gloeocapsa sp. PCC 7428]